MSIRVNLLMADEFRQHSVTKWNISPRAMVMAGAGVVVILLALGTTKYLHVTRGLAVAQERWSEIAEDYEEVTKVEADKRANEVIEGELIGWANSSVAWNAPLVQLARLVPSGIQLTKMTVKCDVQLPRIDPAHLGEPPAPSRQYRIRLDGLANGEFSDKTAVGFVKALKTEPAFEDWLESVQLLGLQKSTTGRSEDPNERVFRVDIVSVAREMK